MKIGIFGLPMCGKSTVFRLLTGRVDLAARDTHGEAQQAAVKLPDGRLSLVTEVFEPKKTTEAEITFVDTVALHQGRADVARAESLTELLGDADACALVVRCFDLSVDDGGRAAPPLGRRAFCGHRDDRAAPSPRGRRPSILR